MTDHTTLAGETLAPIFIHSLFRAGSTYLFNVFRRSSDGYWCYQEPLHEVALLARANPENLLAFRGEYVKHLRHPAIEVSYFRELYDVSDACLDKLSKEAIYDGYFGCVGDFGLNYWAALIAAAKGRPVIQECRTSSRIGAMKNALGGYHIYLWRNPWDEWWSYKVTDYFDATSQLFLNAPSRPPVIERLRREIAFEGFESDDLSAQIDWFIKRRLAPEQSYLIFYVLWILGLGEAVANANLLLNIDRMSDSAEYRNEIASKLLASGAKGLNFSDCSVPQTCYGDGDREFFERIEDKAHGLLLLSGTTQRELDQLLTLRRSSEPLTWRECAARATCGGSIRDADRARALVLTGERREVELRSQFAEQSRVLEQRTCSAEERAVKAEALLAELRNGLAAATRRSEELARRAAVAEATSAEMGNRFTAAEEKWQHEAALVGVLHAERDELQRMLAETRGSVHYWRLESDQWHERLLSVHRSSSWRITAPIRALKRVVKGDLSPVRRTAGWAVTGVRRALRRPAVAAARIVLNQPRLRHKISTSLRKYPGLRQHLVLFVRNAGLMPDASTVALTAHRKADPVTNSPGTELLHETFNPELAHMTASARQIYVDLKVAIEAKKRNS